MPKEKPSKPPLLLTVTEPVELMAFLLEKLPHKNRNNNAAARPPYLGRRPRTDEVQLFIATQSARGSALDPRFQRKRLPWSEHFV
jgi:hypothetical protein